jgi:hypothetical protein
MGIQNHFRITRWQTAVRLASIEVTEILSKDNITPDHMAYVKELLDLMSEFTVEIMELQKIEA